MAGRRPFRNHAPDPMPFGPTSFGLQGGSMVALAMPFLDRAIDEKALAALCLRQAEAGTHAIVVCGTTGEAPALNHAEQRRVIEVAVEAAQGVPVIAGAGTSGTDASIALAVQAEQAGAAALLCVVPYYVRPTQQGIYRHMQAIHDAVGIPLILYDIPGRTGCAMTDETVVALSLLPHVIGLKDAAGDATRPVRLRPRVKDGFLLLSGDDATQAQYRRAGGDGCISVTANITPFLCTEMHCAYDQGNFGLFDRIAQLLMPLNRILFIETNPIPVKYGLYTMGLAANDLRLPLTQLSFEHEERVRVEIDRITEAELEHRSRAIPLTGHPCFIDPAPTIMRATLP